MKRLLRLLLVMMMLLTVPAAHAGAQPVDAGPAHAMASHDMMAHDMAIPDGSKSRSSDHKAPVHGSIHHDCIGCIAPLDIAVYHPARAPRLLPYPADTLADAPYLLSRTIAPEPRPPRSLA